MPTSRSLCSACLLLLPACGDDTWHLRVENQTGQELPKVEGRLSWPDDPHGFGGSAEALRTAGWTQFEGHGAGTPGVWVSVVWSKGEAPQEFALAGLRPGGRDHVARLTKDRKVEFAASQPPAR